MAGRDPPPVSPYMLDYARCTITELRNFLKSRTKHDYPELSRRRDLVTLLEDLDRNATFRFLDLAPELRNNVYEHLLSRDAGKKSKCFPQILRTSKQIHAEARGILVAECTVRTYLDIIPSIGSYDFGRGWMGPINHDVRGTGDIEFTRITGHNVDEEVCRLSQFQKSSLGLNIWTGHQWRQYSGITQFLEKVVQHCQNLRRLEVDVGRYVDWQLQPVKLMLDILAPLIHLPSTVSLRLRSLSEETEAAFWRMANEAE